MKWFAVLFLVLVACARAPAPAPVPAPEPVDFDSASRLGRPVKCVSQHEGQTSTIYLKGSQMRMDTLPADAHGIYTSDAIYTWRGSEGMVIKMEDVKKIAVEQGEAFSPPTQEQILAKAQQENAKCELADVPESMFVPPAGVNFENLGDLMRQIESSAKNMPKPQ
jgi:hypothetical protein